MALGNINPDVSVGSPSGDMQSNLPREESIEQISSDPLSSVDKPNENISRSDSQHIVHKDEISSVNHPLETSSPTEKGSECIVS